MFGPQTPQETNAREGLEAGIEAFRTKYGRYPSSAEIGAITRETRAKKLDKSDPQTAQKVRDLQLAAERCYGFDLERAVYLTVLHRLFVSGSDRAAEAWKENYHIREPRSWPSSISTEPWRGLAKRLEREF